MTMDVEIRSSFPRVLVLTTFTLPAMLSLILLAIRVIAVSEPSADTLATSGGESISIYNVLKLTRGLTLYEDPRIPPYFTTTLYNAGFYEFYGAIAGHLSETRTSIVTDLRFVTLGLACLGLAGLLAYALFDLSRRPPRVSPRLVQLTMTFAAISVLLGRVPGWWLLTVRPDIGAMSFCALAVAVVFGVKPDRDWTAGLLGGVFLAAAWSFKQSTVFLFLGLSTSALLQRRYRFIAGLAIPLAMIVLTFVTVFGTNYRYNSIFATSLSSFDLGNLVRLAKTVSMRGTFPLALAIASLPLLSRLSWLRRDEALGLRVCWWTCLTGAMITCCRNGSSENYFFELWVVVGFLAVIQARALIESVSVPIKRLPVALIILATISLSTSAVETARLILPRRFGSAGISQSQERQAELRRVRALLESQHGPVICQPALWGLAWNLSYPAYVFDDYLYFQKPAQRRGLLIDGGPAGLIARHYFDLMVLEPADNTLLDAALAAGYQRQPGWSTLVVLRALQNGRQ